MEWNEWITQKFIEWRGTKVGQGTSINAFAGYLELPQTVVSRWMQKGGTIPHKPEFINRLVSLYGTEVYEVLGLPVSGAGLSALPQPIQNRLKTAIKEVNQELARLQIDADSDEAETITIQIFVKHGFKYTDTDTAFPPE